jgi:hypothetical protein
MKIKLINGPLHGMELDSKKGDPYIVLLEKTTGKVRRYRRGDFAFFEKEWPSVDAYEKEIDDNS